MAERIIPFPWQKKQLQDGEKLPVVDRVMEESKTIDKWQMLSGIVVSVVNPVAGGAIIGASLVSHELTRAELKRRREKRHEEVALGNLTKAA